MMTNDHYSEQLVAKKSGAADMLKKAGVGIAAALLAAFAVLIAGPMGIVMACLIIYGAFYLITGFDTEYEYIFTNGDLDIDKIMGKRKRKRLVTAKLEEFTAFGKLSDAPAIGSDVTTVLASDGFGGDDYYADFKHSSAGKVRLIFTPDERTIESVATFLPRQVKAEYRQKYGK